MTQPTSPSPEFYAEYTPAAPPAALPRPPLRLSCVVPAFNEAVNLPRFIPALAEAVGMLVEPGPLRGPRRGRRHDRPRLVRLRVLLQGAEVMSPPSRGRSVSVHLERVRSKSLNPCAVHFVEPSFCF